MIRSSAAKWLIGVTIYVILITLLRFRVWERHAGLGAPGQTAQTRQVLAVGYLPVT